VPPFSARGILGRFFGSAISNAAGYAMGGAITPALQPFTQDIANEIWAAHPVAPLTAEQSAQAALYGLLPGYDWQGEATLTGVGAERFNALRELQANVPPSGTLLELLRRGIATPEQVDGGLARTGLLPEWRSRIRQLRTVLPSVSDMVRFAVREVYNPQQRSALDLDSEFPDAFAERAALIGLDNETAREYWAAHWELPSLTQGANMRFRGLISESEFAGLAKALDYAPVWRDKLLEVAKAIPSMSDMVRFAVREVYNPQQRAALDLDGDYPDAFTAQAAKHGLAEQDARDYWAAHWRLPSLEQGFRMLHRGLLTETQMDGLIKAQDYAPIWRPRLAAIAHLVPGRVDLKRMYRFEILTRAQVKAGYIALGYAEPDAEALTRIAEHEADTSATANPWANRARSRLFTVAHNEYQDRSIDEGRAREILTLIGATAQDAGKVLEAWNAELSINRLELTPAQIKKAARNGVYDDATAMAELVERHMSEDDARAFLDS
jgi:hypothetical protein